MYIMEEYLLLGFVVGSHGVNGAMKVLSKTDFAKKRYQKGNKVFMYNPRTKERKELTVISASRSGQFDLVKVEEIHIKEEIDLLKGNEIQVIKDNSMLDKDTYYYSDLEKCDVYDQFGKQIGHVKVVEEFPAQITLRCSRKEKPDFFVPFIEAFILKVDIENKKITINVIEGMLWESQF